MSKLAAEARPLPDAAASDRIIGLMIREAVTAERDRRGWNNLKLSQESGVPYSRLYEWLNDPAKTIHSGHLESLMRVLGLRVCRGRVSVESAAKKRAGK
jgi:hypothetical protein